MLLVLPKMCQLKLEAYLSDRRRSAYSGLSQWLYLSYAIIGVSISKTWCVKVRPTRIIWSWPPPTFVTSQTWHSYVSLLGQCVVIWSSTEIISDGHPAASNTSTLSDSSSCIITGVCISTEPSESSYSRQSALHTRSAQSQAYWSRHAWFKSNSPSDCFVYSLPLTFPSHAQRVLISQWKRGEVLSPKYILRQMLCPDVRLHNQKQLESFNTDFGMHGALRTRTPDHHEVKDSLRRN